MDWITALTLPTAWFLIAAFLSGIATLALALECCQQWQQRALLFTALSGLGLVCALLLSLWLILSALALRGYQPIPTADPLATARSRILAPGRWELLLALPDGKQSKLMLNSDAFQLSAVFARWNGWGPWSRLPSLYRLDQLIPYKEGALPGGSEPISLVSHHALELQTLQRRYPSLLPSFRVRVEASQAPLPLVDRGNYIFSLDPTGHLTGAPDSATARKILRPL